ncbi:hypothetical protein V6D40_07205 [Corynebacterium sp. Q4381]|uniref:hypothetical protein n=1 Tax=Corynebacterium sp. Marseille-Q4381 TaxID=3121597 RepID=UPI002FE55829
MYSSHVYDCSPRFTASDGQPKSVSSKADDLMRLMPRGVRNALVPLAKGECGLDDVPDYALEWLEKHEAIAPARKAGITWKHGPKFKTLLHRISERHK